VKTLTLSRIVLSMVGLLAVLLVCAALGVAFGSTTIDLWGAIAEWFSGDVTSPDGYIFANYRLPRVGLAILVGAALASVGAVFQGLLGNPLADPYILGVSGGASVGVVSAIALGFGGTFLGLSILPASAFAGALLAVAVIYGVASVLPGGVRGQHAVYTLLLVGVVFNAFTMAFVLFVRTLMSPLNSQRILFWMMGSLEAGHLSRAELWTITICIVAGLGFLIVRARTLNLLALGDDTAESLGVDAPRTRLILFLVSSVVVGAAVAVSGVIGFVGLVVPHSLRLLLGADNRLLVPAAAVGGAAFLVLSDLASRMVLPVLESTLPVGVVTAFVGAPLFFVFLVRNLKNEEINRI